MKTERNLGIWMDHQNAHLMEFTTDPIGTQTVANKFTHEVKAAALEKGESLMHHKEQHETTEYYKELGELIREYDHVVLFGPTEAKTELFNSLRKDHRFAEIQIAIEPADKMTTNQQHAFVKAYFSNPLSLI
jgi:ADP-heptose:LPS heptosyltransferase